MGIAAYNRGSKRISDNIDAGQPDYLAQLVRDLNELPKNTDAVRPFGAIEFQYSANHKTWWATCPTTGYGFPFKRLRDAVRSFRVVIVSNKGSTLVAIPN